MPKNKALFLDRDGVVCEAMPRGEYLVRQEQFKLVPGIAELVGHAKKKGYLVVVATNQGAIAKDLISIDDLESIHENMQGLLTGIDKVYYCPHYTQHNCACRKPKPGMLTQAAADLDIDLTSSVFVGDSNTDIEAGKAAGCKTIFLNNAWNAHELARCSPDVVVDALADVHSLLA
ncbi:MAG: HAD family hydrolase [bacterium]|nr:HAD family hydrolase [bacterium]